MINERVTQFLLISLKNKHTYRRCTKLKLPEVEYPFGIGKCERVLQDTLPLFPVNMSLYVKVIVHSQQNKNKKID